MKAVLISIRPKWVELIASGEKTIEVRTTRPKIERPFKCYIYQSGKNLTSTVYGTEFSKSGYVIGEFACDTFITDKSCGHDELFNGAACLKEDEAANYAKGKPLYGWHISSLKMYDEPLWLTQMTAEKRGRGFYIRGPVTRPPMSWMYVEELEGK